jgi:CHAD domain-containing protein
LEKAAVGCGMVLSHDTMRRSSALLRRPAAETARIVGRKYLTKLLECRDTLGGGDDAAALHEFRVALRRLRGVLRAFRPVFEPDLSQKTRRELRRLADSTGECRNLQLQQAWVAAAIRGLAGREKTGARWVLRSIEDRRAAAVAGMRDRLSSWLKDEVPALRRLFRAPKSARGGARRLTTRTVVNRGRRELAEELSSHLAAVHSIRDQAEAHAARIAAKRARYLLQPFAEGVRGAPAAIEQLRRLQDDLGALHDAQVMAGEILGAFARMGAGAALSRGGALLPWAGGAASRDSRPRTSRLLPGLEALARRSRVEGDAAFARVKHEWLRGAATELIGRVRGRRGGSNQSGRPDLNRRLPAPKAGALPD